MNSAQTWIGLEYFSFILIECSSPESLVSVYKRILHGFRLLSARVLVFELERVFPRLHVSATQFQMGGSPDAWSAGGIVHSL